MPAYKSFCWALGTTSFRMVEFNRKIEQQLGLLQEFWAEPQHAEQPWSSNSPLQTEYYNHLKARGFIEDRNAPRKDKDAREKTSGLVDLGLINDERRLTAAGEALLQMANEGNFHGDNLLQIPADSFLYFKQLLKVSYDFDGEAVRPYLVLAYLLSQLGELSKEEFTYLLPLATNPERTELVLRYIREIRACRATMDEAILSALLQMENYREAQQLFLTAEEVNDALMQEIGMNRKSRVYDRPYTVLYHSLLTFAQAPDREAATALLEAVNGISGNARSFWKPYLFNTPLTSVIRREGVAAVNDVDLFHTQSEREFRTIFFRLLHLFKAKSLLSDYYDLNRRYFKTTDTLLFRDGQVQFDVIPRCFFAVIGEDLPAVAFTRDPAPEADGTLSEINPLFDVSAPRLFAKAEELYGTHVEDLPGMRALVQHDRYLRFHQMIDTRFSDEQLVRLMDLFERREDGEIRELVTNNADLPTIFEYVVAIAWYKISGRHGDVLSYMNLSLDADLLPITHAGGGREDITYHYQATEDYPAHTLLIEVTLANGTAQRRMEMEPVSRHLGEYLLAHTEETYCVFITPFLHCNVTSDFRGRKQTPYYTSDGTRGIDGMKIIPCQTAEIKRILQRGISYGQLYQLFETAYHSQVPPNLWYNNEIANAL